MNIKKKISFFALFLISSFFIVSEVKGYDNYGLYGGGNNQLINMKDVRGSSWEFSESGIGFRVTFTNETGVKISGSKIVDYYPKGTNVYFVPSNNTTNGKYKFSTSSESINVIKNFNFDVNGCSNSLNCNKEFINTWRNKIVNNTFMKTLLSNAGITNPPNTVYIVVEKLYTILVVKQNRSVCNTTNCQNLKEDKCKKLTTDSYDGTLDSVAFNGCKRDMVIYNINDIQTSYRGTASEIAKIIDTERLKNKDVYNNLWLSVDMKNELGTGFDIEKTNDIYGFEQLKKDGFKRENFYAAKPTWKLNWSDIYNNSYANGLFIIKASVSNGCNTKTDADRLGLDWDFSSNTCCKEGTYYKHAVGDKKNGACCPNSTDEYDKLSQRCVTKGTCTKDNHVQKNRDWNSKKNVCCNVGELFNGTDCTTKKATQSVGKTVTYKFTTYPSINECMNGTLNSVLSNLDVEKSKARVETSGTNFNAREADLVIYNSKYKVANKTDIYCKETLTTSFDDVKNNFNDLFSGVYVPIKKQPTLTKEISCYLVDQNAGTKDSRANEGASFVTNQSSDINVILYFMNGYKGPNYTSKGTNYSFTNPRIKTENVSVTNGNTTYGVKYTLVKAKLKYTFAGLNIENKYIDISTATNTNLINDSKKYKTIDTSSIGVPTSAVSGHYNNTIYLKKLDGLLSKMNVSYSTRKTLTKDSGTGYCKLNYQMPSEISDCSSKYRELINRGGDNTIGYSGKWEGGWCNFDILYKSSSLEYCEYYLGRNDSNSSTEYVSSEDKTVLNFVNNKSSATATAAACHFDIEIKDYELVFRPISLSNPFPGSNGKGRTPNSKVWDTDKIDTYIKNRQDTYTKKPLYSVTLTPSQIQNIREYNRTHKYDNFDLKCVGSKTGTACYSSFIRTYLNTNKSICANINDQSEKSFNSCADYNKRI